MYFSSPISLTYILRGHKRKSLLITCRVVCIYNCLEIVAPFLLNFCCSIRELLTKLLYEGQIGRKLKEAEQSCQAFGGQDYFLYCLAVMASLSSHFDRKSIAFFHVFYPRQSYLNK